MPFGTDVSKLDTYFNDLTSCSLLGFLKCKRLTDKRKAHSVYKGTLIYLAQDDTLKPENKTFAQACLSVFEGAAALTSVLLMELFVRPLCQWWNYLCVGLDYTLPPILCVAELRPRISLEQAKSVAVQQYWMKTRKEQLGDEIDLEEIGMLKPPRIYENKVACYEKKLQENLKIGSDDNYQSIQLKRRKSLSKKGKKKAKKKDNHDDTFSNP
ncbi:12314_t:CDS:2 [Dentiscutata erythropus]|uniref:12314_t:CDS:1 n=1 Tax=Dentiscutata erythropus TaxID=1348616 RepID=A0A9N9H5G4_9GLOM|nr:12314_t:CDS:2 [Dentiscutata erythropus]